MAAAAKTETVLTAEAAATSTAEAAAVTGRQRYRQGNIGTTMTQQPARKTFTQAMHCVVVNNGDWYYDDNHNNDFYNDDDHVDDLRKGGGKTKPAAAAEAPKAAEAVAVATARADINQQRAVKLVAAVIAVGKRRKARGEKHWRSRRWGGGWRRRLQGRQRWQRWPVGRGQR